MKTHITLRPYVLFWHGQQHVVRSHDRMQAKVIAYTAIWPQSKWDEIRG